VINVVPSNADSGRFLPVATGWFRPEADLADSLSPLSLNTFLFFK
jgi:hypothetical protein